MCLSITVLNLMQLQEDSLKLIWICFLDITKCKEILLKQFLNEMNWMNHIQKGITIDRRKIASINSRSYKAMVDAIYFLIPRLEAST
jgi:hypothetical protein